MKNILGEKPALDLTIRHAGYKFGDISVYMTWLIQTGEACAVLVPTHTQLSHERVIPCIVPLSSAHLWDETVGDGRHVAQNSYRFATNLGFNPNDPDRIFKIAAIIRDLIGELVSMPPMPSYVLQKTHDVLVTDIETGKSTEKELSDHV